jgi:hypothetical protein
MLSYVDRVQVVVRDRSEAAATWQAIFGATVVGEDGSRSLNAHRTTVQAGVSEFELLQPAGPGPIEDFANRWGQGLYGVGFSTPDIAAMGRHLSAEGVQFSDEKGRLYLAAGATHGMPTVILGEQSREPVGRIRHVYEVTNPVASWEDTSKLYSRIFGLDAKRFSPIESQLYGYKGTLTLFDPPGRLDRIEVTQTWGGGAMDRFYERRGPSLYMCYVETDDIGGLASALRAQGARLTDSEDRPPETGLFIHPSALNGMLMGVSRTNYAWAWSGRPELAGAGVEGYRAH